MRYVSTDFTTLLSGVSFPIAICIKITERSGGVKTFTDWSSDLVVDGSTYRSSIGVRFYSIESNAGFDTGTWAIEGLISAASYSLEELRALTGYLGNSVVELFAVNPKDLTMGTWPLKYGRIARVLPKGEFFSLECEGLDSKLSRTPLVQTYQLDCRFEFGDANCTFSPDTYAGTITTITDDFTIIDSSFGGPATAGFFSYGKIVFDDLPDFVNRVKLYDSGSKTFTLFLPMPLLSGAPRVGGNFTVYQGCSKKYRYCRDTIGNVENFGGFPFIPDRERLKFPLSFLGGSGT